MKTEICKECKGTGIKEYDDEDLSCPECSGMGEIYDDNEVQE